MKSYLARPASKIRGSYFPPGDKSISHRAIMFASVASGKSKLTNFLEAEDCLHTMKAFRAMGISIIKKGKSWIVRGRGLTGLKVPKKEIYLGNSGTSIRLIMGILVHQPFRARLSGDPSLSKRPMKRVTVPLRKMGANISGRDDANFAPLTIEGAPLHAIRFVNEKASAQVKSAVILAALRASGTTLIREKMLSRDHSERMLAMMGAKIKSRKNLIEVRTTSKLKPIQYQIPGDISSAAFFIVAAALLPGSRLTVKHVGLNPTRIGLLEVLRAMGAKIKWKVTSKQKEPSGTITVQGSTLKGTTISKKMIPRLIDELPVLMIACGLARGKSTIRDARELRVKETDRIQSMVRGLNAIGGNAKERPDGCVIFGVDRYRGGKIKSYGDHRTAMSFAVAALRSRKPILIEDVACVSTSYPGFFRDLKALTKT